MTEISCIESDGEPNEPSEINSILKSVNQNTTNRSDNAIPLHQQSCIGNQHNLAKMQSNDSSTHELNSNNSATIPIATNPASSSTTTSGLHVESSQSTTQTGVGLTSSVAPLPSTETSFTRRNMEENKILPHKDQTSTTMQTPGNREPPDGAAPSTYSQNSSDTKLKVILP